MAMTNSTWQWQITFPVRITSRSCWVLVQVASAPPPTSLYLETFLRTSQRVTSTAMAIAVEVTRCDVLRKVSRYSEVGGGAEATCTRTQQDRDVIRTGKVIRHCQVEFVIAIEVSYCDRFGT